MNYFYVINYKKYQSICRTSSRFELGMKNYLNKTGSENQVESSGNSLIESECTSTTYLLSSAVTLRNLVEGR